MSKIQDLKSIIYYYDELLDYWFDGTRPCDTDEENVYATADDLRNRAIAILEEMEQALNKLQ